MFAFLETLADTLLSPVLSPLLELHPALTIFIVALFVSTISVLIQKNFTNQKRLKQIKKDTKKLQADIKKAKGDDKEQMRLNKKILPMQGEMMRETLKPTLWTMIPFLFLFLWLSANFAFAPLLPSTAFEVSAYNTEQENISIEVPTGVTLLTPATQSVVEQKATWELSGSAGFYSLTFLSGSDVVTKNILITKEKEYETPLEVYSGEITKVEVGNTALKPLDPMTLFGWRPGWIATYIIFSLILSIGLRKWLDVA